jgi:hypothetical protein
MLSDLPLWRISKRRSHSAKEGNGLEQEDLKRVA